MNTWKTSWTPGYDTWGGSWGGGAAPSASGIVGIRWIGRKWSERREKRRREEQEAEQKAMAAKLLRKRDLEITVALFDY